VGTFALQIARLHEAEVTAVDKPGKLYVLQDMGAHRVIDYLEEDFTRADQCYDLIFGVPGHRPFSAFWRALKPDGRYEPIRHGDYGALGQHVFGLIPHFL
jgi:NADPH:quinone reductase-like Zn-dependent oxidoreductase